ARRAEYEAKAQAIADEAQARLAKIDGSSVTIYANASTEGKLYGSVGPRDIAEALTKAGTPVEKSEVVMGEGPLRNTGEYEVTVHLRQLLQNVLWSDNPCAWQSQIADASDPSQSSDDHG